MTECGTECCGLVIDQRLESMTFEVFSSLNKTVTL